MVICGRDAKRLEATLSELEGANHLMLRGDLVDDAAIAQTVEAAGKVDGVVHFVGISMLMPIRMISREYLERVFGVNYFAPILLTQRLLAKGRVNKGGSILFLSSTAAFRGVHGVGAYSGTKAALVATTRCLALETAKHGIRVNCIAPDLIETPLLEGSGTLVSTAEWLEQQRKIHPLGLGTPDDVANAAIYFLSDASRWVTGTSLIMDGGITH
jgi:NAD(P)-dependent dehydrogenase (short-subunit alcohol dehydrogenase family)